MNKPRLLKLADFLEKLKPHKLDMSVVCHLRGSKKMNPHECKSAACAMGWTPAAFPRLMKWTNFADDFDDGDVALKKSGRLRLDYDAMERLFDINTNQATSIFGSGGPRYHTPKQVALGIREFVKTGVIPDIMEY